MTLRARWAVSISAILGLFGLNLAVYFWGNAERTGILLELKRALESKELAVEIRNTIADSHRDVDVMEPLVTSRAVRLDADQLGEVRHRLSDIENMIGRLRALSSSPEIGRLESDYRSLAESWLAVYEPPAEEPLPNRASSPIRGRRYSEMESLLEEIVVAEAAGVDRAERDFGSVTQLTNRVTLAIFAASSLLAIVIAVWFSRFLRSALARYVSTEVADSVLQSPSGLELGGEKRMVTVLMADLRGFSSMSERLPPEQVVTVVNNFLGVMTEIIVAAGGTIDEFIGDAILVIFGAPVERKDHAGAAVECALRMQLAMSEVNDRNRSANLPSVEMGIGVHSGEVVVGNIGSAKRTKYGAVGTNVNLTARIEGNTVGGQVLISSATLDRAALDLRVDARLQIHPKGFEQPVSLFDIGGMTTGTGAQLDLPERGESLVGLADALAVRFALMNETKTGTQRWDGELVSLSPRAARVRSSADVAPLANLRLELFPGDDLVPAGSLFAKVVSVEPGGDSFVARFTSIDPATAKTLERLPRRRSSSALSRSPS